MMCIYFQAPFAVFRTFTAGSFRPTAPFMTPSAAYGLLLNLAGIEMRDDDGASEMTLIRSGLPHATIALGLKEERAPKACASVLNLLAVPLRRAS